MPAEKNNMQVKSTNIPKTRDKRCTVIIIMIDFLGVGKDDINILAGQNICKKWGIVSDIKCNTDKLMIGNRS